MNKRQLSKLLEPLSNDAEIFICFGQDKNNLTIVKPVTSAINIRSTATPSNAELWLGFEEV